jgi:hypothetical protein
MDAVTFGCALPAIDKMSILIRNKIRRGSVSISGSVFSFRLFLGFFPTPPGSGDDGLIGDSTYIL